MIEYKYITTVINKFNLPLEVKLATPKSSIDQKLIDETTAQITKKLEEYDEVFSIENKNSFLYKFQNGDETALIVSDPFKEVYEQTIMAEQMTQHYFSSYYNGKYDPIGLLNGWTIDKLFNQYLLPLLSVDGIDGVSLRCGEEVRLASRPNIDFRWRVAIKDPRNLNNLLATYFLQNGAVSTSNEMKSLRNEKSKIEQVTIVSNNALDANIWSSAGISAGTNKFPSFIAKYSLTGMIVDKDSGLINFRDGFSDKIAMKK
ncbi:FAD:protein FMN transferase [Companilactobacillus halodurans]|uniref:FAD:protein FMN transferase n=1 Tax=Companilactobacillus halodurans TaxID=2584183 RepID=A0A5P1A037_9LACO|nr:FAD:protein FMN transferase [Companilactobacillus halodurans]MQS98304.1 FAD:protein FMN transferase [Companilactobacillus halodurans]